MLTYHDTITGEKRFKRRYVWALWGLITGIALGVTVTELLL